MPAEEVADEIGESGNLLKPGDDATRGPAINETATTAAPPPDPSAAASSGLKPPDHWKLQASHLFPSRAIAGAVRELRVSGAQTMVLIAAWIVKSGGRLPKPAVVCTLVSISTQC